MLGMQTRKESVHALVERTQPSPWEREETFAETVHDWLQRSPAFGISMALHFAVVMALAAIPWNLFDEDEPVVITAQVVAPLEEFPDDPPPEEPVILEPKIELDEPIDAPVVPDAIPGEDDPSEEPNMVGSDSDNDDRADTMLNGAPVLGIGGPPSGKVGGRGTPGGVTGGVGSYNAEVELGLAWLADHQNEDGSWDADGFQHTHGCQCDGPGSASQDVGVTALALMAFTGRGYTPARGKYKRSTARAMEWLRAQQNSETGLIGEDLGHAFLYDHGLATLALCDLYLMTRVPMLRTPCQKAINYVGRARNPYGAWRYDVPATGDNDTSVTGWMVFALSTAKDAGLKVDNEAFTGALTWFDEVTDTSTGRTGYDRTGSVSSRIENVNDHFAPEKGEAMTAVALLCRFFLGQDPEATPIMSKQADLLAKLPPVWEPDAHGCDMYAWYYATYAMFQMGGRHWKAWKKSLGPAIAESQRTDGHLEGSWDPAGPWGYSGGRVYATALMTLCLEVEQRYTRVR